MESAKSFWPPLVLVLRGVAIDRQSEDRSRDVDEVDVLQTDERSLQIGIDERPGIRVPIVCDPVAVAPGACAQVAKLEAAACRIAGNNVVLHRLPPFDWAGV